MFHFHSFAGADPAFCCSAGTPTANSSSIDANDAFFDPHPNTTSPPPSFSSSLPDPHNNYFLHRSSSTHSLTRRHSRIPDPTPTHPLFSSSSPSSHCDFLDFHSEPVRRVYSTGDLQGMNCGQEGSTAAGKVGRYSAEERKERIERYRIKRNQRNFHKKITYACRKTLADSRPRVRGRFARNEETEAEVETITENSFENYANYSDNNYNNSGNYNCHDDGSNNNGDWWRRQMQSTTVTMEEEESCNVDDIWASFDNVFAMNLLS